MEWTGAKRFVIVLLIIINVVLAGLNIKQSQDNTMTAAQEKAIFEVLSENGISMYTDLKIDAQPMDRLEADVPTYVKEDLEAAVFDGEKTRVSLGTQKIYKTDTKMLTLDGDRGIFLDETIEKGLTDFSKADAIKLAERKMKGMEDLFGHSQLSYVSKEEDSWKIEFCTTYKGNIIFSNKFTFYVSDMGLYEFDFTYCQITGIRQEKKDICLADEALLTFMREWKKRDETKNAAIQKLELGYDLLEQGTAVAGTGLYLEPCYRIYLMEESNPYLVNAYTCQIVKKNVE